MRRCAAILTHYRRTLGPDLRRFYHIDIRDIGRGLLSPGDVIDLVEDVMTLDSSTARLINGGPVWQVEHYLAADNFHATTGKPHPGRPKPTTSNRETDPQFLRARERARARARDRQRAIDAGEITVKAR